MNLDYAFIIFTKKMTRARACVRNPAQTQSSSNWMDMNTMTNACSSSNNRVGRLNSQCEVNNRSAANLRSLNVPSVIGQLHIRSVYLLPVMFSFGSGNLYSFC